MKMRFFQTVWRQFFSFFRLPVIVRLMGGLGNQMFQYAFGRALAESNGRRVFFDMSWFRDSKKSIVNSVTNENIHGVVIRDYALNSFSIDVPIANAVMVRLCAHYGGVIYEPETSYRKKDDSLLKHKGCGVWCGYFQNEKYFIHIRPYIEKAFSFPSFSKDDFYNQDLLKKIDSFNSSVFVHVRRGDFVNLGWQLSTNYYKNAAAYISSHLQDPHFFVFGENVPEIMDVLCMYSSYVVWIGDNNTKNDDDWKDMSLMMSCNNAIVANSTFSWWAAWLGRAKNGIVVAPSPYFEGSDDGVCENWVKISQF